MKARQVDVENNSSKLWRRKSLWMSSKVSFYQRQPLSFRDIGQANRSSSTILSSIHTNINIMRALHAAFNMSSVVPQLSEFICKVT